MTAAVRLPEDLEKRLDVLVQKTHHSKNYYLRKALEEYLEDQEDYMRAAVAWEEHQKSGKKGISLEELVKKYHLDD